MILALRFVDVHTHSDEVVDSPRAENFCLSGGATTIVGSNCGNSSLSAGQCFYKIERTQVPINVATIIGHNTACKKAMGPS